LSTFLQHPVVQVCPAQQHLSDWTALSSAPDAAAVFAPVFDKYEHSFEHVHDWSIALSSISRTILSLLLLKELLIVFAIGVKRYFKTGPHVIDFVIIVVAWSLELYYFVEERQINQSFKDGRPLLFMIVIAWRVVRMVHILLENITGIVFFLFLFLLLFLRWWLWWW